jgi:diaminohydroxyphosphoribosylaminopyrimidine deaminase/5-amino-6-(5-phosphoribosylamino)uracil reductase
MAAFQERGIELLPVPETRPGRLALEPALARLASEELTSLLVEGGGETNAAFISQGFGDRIWFAVAPRLLGGRQAPTPFEGEGFATVAEALALTNVSVVQIGTDFIFEGYLFGREPACSLA